MAANPRRRAPDLAPVRPRRRTPDGRLGGCRRRTLRRGRLACRGVETGPARPAPRSARRRGRRDCGSEPRYVGRVHDAGAHPRGASPDARRATVPLRLGIHGQLRVAAPPRVEPHEPARRARRRTRPTTAVACRVCAHCNVRRTCVSLPGRCTRRRVTLTRPVPARARRRCNRPGRSGDARAPEPGPAGALVPLTVAAALAAS
jgi:hypothetical protein